MFIITQNRTIF